jgi:hypothetical protein
MWVKLDDGFDGHPKVIALYDGDHAADALALWTRCASWSGKHLTEGRIPRGLVRQSPHAAGAAELVRVGLWLETPEGYAFHDWLRRNPAKSAVEEKQAKTRERLAAWRAKQAENAQCNAVTTPAVTLSPTRPDPLTTRERQDELRPPLAKELKTHLALNAPAREEQRLDQGPIGRAEQTLSERDVALIRAKDSLRALRSTRTNTEDYLSKLYDAEQTARQAEEARDRAKRQLAELRDPQPQRQARK